MDLRSYLSIFRRRWVILLGSTLIGLASAVSVSALTQPQYEASVQLFVTATGGSSVVEAYQGNLFGQQRAEDYAKLADGRQVAQRTIDALKLDMKPDALMGMVSAERVPGDTVLIAIRVRNPNPEMARDLANGVAQQTTQLVEQLETSPRGGIPAATTVLVDQAVTPSSPVVPNWTRNILLGVIAGLVVGMVASVARDRGDLTVLSAVGGASAIDARALGSVPPRPPRPPAIPIAADEPEVVDAFRAVRTNLLAAGLGDSNLSHALVMAEPTRGGAATTVTLGLSASLAESGRSVCLVDCDLQARRATQALGMGSAAGVAEILAEAGGVDDKLARTKIERLTVLPAGQPPSASTGDLLGRPELAQMIKHLTTTFNFVLIDAPPVLPSSDAGVIASAVRGVLLVARAQSTRTQDLVAAATKLRMAGSEPFGVVTVNQKRPSYEQR
ncbi:AAA family ATPase [Mycolicibacterium sp. 018/SC-01/001]|uniref:polysaccharide biosynthesis tyrosine autokinase n=1 Tax=Mycolicibacterium sp. 018/SC-01/001 TaxID=2592069 RepID=UPI00117DA596|nr:polysaccharide biosynthesis tyrosine autokinase [Mycolicibacterium sp. 018/SC-01/001]TRW80492.1 AAA family ATPase [Mycolicibacterium sp. 018/SC-01/001]